MTIRYHRCYRLDCEWFGIVLAPCCNASDIFLPDAEPEWPPR